MKNEASTLNAFLKLGNHCNTHCCGHMVILGFFIVVFGGARDQTPGLYVR